MKKTNKKDETRPPLVIQPVSAQERHVFEVGDMVVNQEKHFSVITEVGLTLYKFVSLESRSIEAFVGPGSPTKKVITWPKGIITSQPFSVFDKYNMLYVPKL